MHTRSATGRRAGRAAVIAAVLVLLVLLASPAAAVEAQGLRVDVAERSLLGHGSFLRPAIPPGGAATYSLRVRNLREQPVEVLVYGADLIAGTNDVAPGTDNEGVGGWITAARPRLEVPGQGTEQVDVTIQRPAGDEEGGRGAVVVQLSDTARQELSLERIQRAAVRVEVEADGNGDGVTAEVLGTDLSAGLLPGVLTVDVRYPSAGDDQEITFDSTLVLSRPFVEDPTYDAAVDVLAPDQAVTTTVEVDLPWYGVVGHARAEAAVVGLTTRSAPVRVVVIPPWLALLLVVVAGVTVLRVRRSGLPFDLGRVPGFGIGDTEPTEDLDDGPVGATQSTDEDTDQ